MEQGSIIRPKSWRDNSADRVIESIVGPYLFTRDILTGKRGTVYQHEIRLWGVV